MTFSTYASWDNRIGIVQTEGDDTYHLYYPGGIDSGTTNYERLYYVGEYNGRGAYDILEIDWGQYGTDYSFQETDEYLDVTLGSALGTYTTLRVRNVEELRFLDATWVMTEEEEIETPDIQTELDITGTHTQEYLYTYYPYFSELEEIKYYIHNADSLLDAGTGTRSLPLHEGDEDVIEKAFREIDGFIDLDFEREYFPSQAQIHLYKVSPESPYVIDEGIIGYAMPSTEGKPIPSLSNTGLLQSVFWTSVYADTSPYITDEDGSDYGLST